VIYKGEMYGNVGYQAQDKEFYFSSHVRHHKYKNL